MRSVVIVQTVTAQESEQDTVLHLLLRDIGQIDTGRVTLVFDVETELGLLDRRGKIIHVFHHQSPVRLCGIVRRVLQRFHEESFRGLRLVAGKLTHLIGHAAVGELIGHRQHLVGLQSCLQRHIAQCGVHRIFRRCQQTGTRQFLIVLACLEVFDSRQHSTCLVDVTGSGKVSRHPGILGIGLVTRHGQFRELPLGMTHLTVLTEIGQSHDIAGVGRRSGLVGHPDLHTVDHDARQQVRQLRHCLVIVLMEVVREEEVTVFLVVGNIKLERCRLGTALRTDTLRR